MLRWVVLLTAMLGWTATAVAVDGFVSKRSAHGVSETLDRLETAVREAGMTVVARVDHSAAAKKADLELRPTAVLMFGNPKVGTPLMQSAQTIGVDLPMRAVAWQDEKGQVWLGYDAPSFLARRHGIDDRNEVVTRMAAALDRFADAATRAEYVPSASPRGPARR